MTLVRWMFLCLMLGVVLAGPARASVIRDLDEAQVPVSGQGADERATALHDALSQVLVKITGRRDIADDPKVKPVLDAAQSYVQQYRYREPTDAGPGAAPQAAGSQLLWVHFDGDALDRDLSRQGIPVWGRTRPGILLWLAVDEGDQRYIAGGDKASDLQTAVADAARRRGLPVFVPLLDLQDQMALTFADVWGNFQQTITQASQRYRPDAVLVGRLYRPASGAGWKGRWTLYQGEAAASWDGGGDDPAAAAAAGIDTAADTLGAQYARVINPEATATVSLQVDGVATAADYARVMKYLAGLEPVSHAEVTHVAPDHIDVTLSLLSDAKTFAQRLTLDPVLEQDDNPPAGATPGGDILVYRLSP